MISTLSKLMPYYSDITKIKRRNILNSFEDVEYFGGGDSNKPKTILQREGHFSSYIYIILSGEMTVYKKIKGLYEEKVEECCESGES